MDTNRVKTSIYNIMRHVRRITWWQILLLVGVGSFAYYGYLFFGRSGFSGSDVAIVIEGPESFKAQEKVEFEIKISNQSKFEIESSEVFITLPDFLAFDGGEGRERNIVLANIASGQEVSERITVFAEETEVTGTIKARIEYTPKNLQGKFEKTAHFDVSVASLPLTVIFDVPKKVVSGQTLRGSFHFVAEHELESLPLIVKIVPPEDFLIADAAPGPDEAPATWIFKKVEPKETYEVEFEGVISGEESAIKIFELLFGNTNEDGLFAAQYTVLREVHISSSPLQFTQSVNGATEYVASPGDTLRFRIGYKNTSGVNIENVRITAQLTGDAFDLGTLNAGQGYFSSNTKTITWNKDLLSSLATLDKEESGTIEFSLSLKDEIVPKSYRDKHILVKSKAVIDSGKIPLALQGLSLRAEDLLLVKIRTAVGLVQKVHYYEGPFSNSGSIPPKVGQKTTYTVVWQATNTLNDLADARIEAPLPRHVAFEERWYPSNNKLLYNSETHSVSWDIGTLSAGTGSISPIATVAFQVSLTPTEEMRGKTAELIEAAKISGQDAFVGELAEAFAPALDTTLPDDVGIREGDGVVE